LQVNGDFVLSVLFDPAVSSHHLNVDNSAKGEDRGLDALENLL